MCSLLYMRKYKEHVEDNKDKFSSNFSELRSLVNNKTSMTRLDYPILIGVIFACYESDLKSFRDLVIPYLFNRKNFESFLGSEILDVQSYDSETIVRMTTLLNKLKGDIDFSCLFFDFQLKIDMLNDTTINLIKTIGEKHINLIIKDFTEDKIRDLIGKINLDELRGLYIESGFNLDYGIVSKYVTGFHLTGEYKISWINSLNAHDYPKLKFLKIDSVNGSVDIEDIFSLNGCKLEVIDFSEETEVNNYVRYKGSLGGNIGKTVRISDINQLNKFKELRVLVCDFISNKPLYLGDLHLKDLEVMVIGCNMEGFEQFQDEYKDKLKALICLKEFSDGYEIDDKKIVQIVRKFCRLDSLMICGGYVSEEGLQAAIEIADLILFDITDSEIEDISDETLQIISRARVEWLTLHGNFIPQERVNKLDSKVFGKCHIVVNYQNN